MSLWENRLGTVPGILRNTFITFWFKEEDWKFLEGMRYFRELGDIESP